MRLEQLSHGSGAFLRASEEVRVCWVCYKNPSLYKAMRELLVFASPLGHAGFGGEDEHAHFDNLQIHRVFLCRVEGFIPAHAGHKNTDSDSLQVHGVIPIYMG